MPLNSIQGVMALAFALPLVIMEQVKSVGYRALIRDSIVTAGQNGGSPVYIGKSYKFDP